MKKLQHTIQDEMGLHARPVGQIVKMLKPFSSKVTMTSGEKSCDMKKLIAMMSMGIKQGATVEITVEGDDEEACAAEMTKFFAEQGV